MTARSILLGVATVYGFIYGVVFIMASFVEARRGWRGRRVVAEAERITQAAAYTTDPATWP